MEKTYTIYDPSRDVMFEVSKEIARKFIASAVEVEKQIADDEALELENVDDEIARLQSLKAKKGENENE